MEAAVAELVDEREGHVWRVLYRVAQTAATAHDLPAFYRAMHAIVGELMDATNFFIALYDEERQRICFPYYVDEVEDDLPDPRPVGAVRRRQRARHHGVPAAHGRAAAAQPGGLRRLIDSGEIELVGALGEGDWLGVPLKAAGRVVGVLTVQSYTAAVGYSDGDRDLLAYVAQHIGAALERVRALEETRQRTIELETVNSVVQALAAQLDLDALLELVGERMRDTFQADIVYVALLDQRTDPHRVPVSRRAGRARPAALDRPRPGAHRRDHPGRTSAAAQQRRRDREATATALGTPCSSIWGSRSCSATRRSA